MRSSWVSFAAICIVLSACTFAAYWTVMACGFVSLDDADYVYRNSHVLSGLTWSGWVYAWTSWDCSNWHPLTWLSLELDASLWGSQPAGYHATNLLLHVVNTVLLFSLLYRITSNVGRSIGVAALFALHPLHVESVAWIAERKDVLSTFFLLLTILAYVRYASRPSRVRYLAVVFLFSLGLLAKPMLVTAPILLLLVDFWPLGRIAWRDSSVVNPRFPTRSFYSLVVEKIPLLILAVADGLMTIAAQYGPVKLMVDVTVGSRIANLFSAYLWYLQKTFVPTKLTIFYPHPEQNVPLTQAVLGVAAFIAISAWVIWRRRKSPHLLFGWAWFVISLLPVIGLIQVGCQAYADRYVYIPHIGLFIALVWELFDRLNSTKIGSIIGFAILLAACISSGVLTHAQTKYWRSNDALWTHAIEINPNNGFAHAHLADVRFEAGDFEQAMRHIEAGLRIKRSGYVANAYCNWGRCLIELNREPEAEEKFLAALKVDPNHQVSLDEFAKLLRKQGRNAEAAKITARQEAISLEQAQRQPDSAAARMTLGLAEARQGHLEQSLAHFQRAVELAPQSAEPYFNVALVQIQLRRFVDAKANLIRALELKPDLAAAHRSLAKLLEQDKDISGAKAHLAEAIRLNPADTIAKQQLERLATP